jgi:hypothetical protein
LATTGHSLTSEDVLMAGKVEFDSNTYFDATSYWYTSQYWMQGASLSGAIRGFEDDGFRIHVGSQWNRHLIIADTDWINRDYDHDTLSADPTVFIHGVTDPDTTNTHWGSLAYVSASTLFNIGTGLGPVRISPAADYGVEVYTTGSRPTAGATYRGQLWLERGGASVADLLYMCLKADDESYSWVQIATG